MGVATGAWSEPETPDAALAAVGPTHRRSCQPPTASTSAFRPEAGRSRHAERTSSTVAQRTRCSAAGVLAQVATDRPYPRLVIELGSRRRSQPAPPHVIWEALTQPRRAGARQWLDLHDDEVAPVVIEAHEPHLVMWASIWPCRPRDRAVFNIAAAGSGSDLRWTLLTED